MPVSVPEARGELVEGEIESAKTVRAVSWAAAAQLQCWLAGRGSMDVPQHSPGTGVAASSSTTFRFWTKPRFETTRYAYTFVLTNGSGTGSPSPPGSCTVKIPTGGIVHTVSIGYHDAPTPVTVFVDRAEQANTETELSFDILTGGTQCDVESISIEALPRTLLLAGDEPSNLITHASERLITHAGEFLVTHPVGDFGVDRSVFWPRQPILSQSLSERLLKHQNDLRDACRRVGMFQFSRGTGSPWAITTASPSWAALFVDAIPLLGRAIYNGDTTRTLSWRVLVKCSDGTTAGQVRVSNTSGGTGVSTITVPAGTTNWTWLPATTGAAATFACDCENNTVVNGLRSSRWDDHTFEANRTAGSGSVQIATISVFEA